MPVEKAVWVGAEGNIKWADSLPRCHISTIRDLPVHIFFGSNYTPVFSLQVNLSNKNYNSNKYPKQSI